jgi:molybdenum cofactor biosynthesis enzyme MoaA
LIVGQSRAKSFGHAERRQAFSLYDIIEKTMFKIRLENSGIHLFNRKTGLHILFDEYANSKEIISIVPRTLSMALTNKCNLDCYFCYAPKNSQEQDFKYICEVASIFDKFGGLEITLGGGEPFLHPNFREICSFIWNKTNLGLSVTTNGNFLTDSDIDVLPQVLSSLRVSIDAPEPEYKKIRKFDLNKILPKLKSLANRMPVAINSVISPQRIHYIEPLLEIGNYIGVYEMLIIPEHNNGSFNFTELDWKRLKDSITKNENNSISIVVSEVASKYLNFDYLITEKSNEFTFAHLSASKNISFNSYIKSDIQIENASELIESFIKLQKGVK